MVSLSPSAQKVQDALVKAGFSNRVIELPATTRTAAEAAATIGCETAQIAKSLIFRIRSERPLLVIASGSNRVNEKQISHLIGEPIGKADAEFVRHWTGFAIGGVPPLGHAHPITTLIDQDLQQQEQIWAAAGTPFAVFRLTLAELVQMTQGQIVNVKG